MKTKTINMVNLPLEKKYAPKVGKNGRLDVWLLTMVGFDGYVCSSAYTSFAKVAKQVKDELEEIGDEFTDELKRELGEQLYIEDSKGDKYYVENVEVW